MEILQYQIINELLEFTIYSVILYIILGVRPVKRRIYWPVVVTLHLLVWGIVIAMQGIETAVMLGALFLEILLPAFVAEGKLTKRLAASFFVYTMTGLGLAVLSRVMQCLLQTGRSSREMILYHMICLMIVTVIGVYIAHQHKNISIEPIPSGILVMFGIFCFVVNIMIVNIRDHDFTSKGAVGLNIIAIILLFVAFIISIIFLLLISRKHYQTRQKNQEQQKIMASQQQYCEEVLLDRMQIRSIYHDMNHIITALQLMFDQGQYEEAAALVDQMGHTLHEKRHQYVYTGEQTLDAILSYYADQTQQNQISYDVQTQIEKKIDLQKYEMYVILLNLLSNAVEAAQHVNDSRFVNVILKQNQEQLYIRIENAYDPEYSNLRFTYSTKEEGDHGFGVANIRNAAKRIGGELHYEIMPDRVIAEVIC